MPRYLVTTLEQVERSYLVDASNEEQARELSRESRDKSSIEDNYKILDILHVYEVDAE
jgi:hypothetical protein